jgi:ADP-ribosylglycohydrolase
VVFLDRCDPGSHCKAVSSQESGVRVFAPRGRLSIARWRKPLDKTPTSIVFFALKGRLLETCHKRPFRAKARREDVGLVVPLQGLTPLAIDNRPLGAKTLWHQGPDTDLITDARLQSRVTHGHVRSQVCCALYCLWARRILQEQANPWEEAVAVLRRSLAGEPEAVSELEFHIRPDDAPSGEGSGYVVDCLRSSRVALLAGDYEAVVKAAIGMGRDTDTTACVADGIAGLRDGVEMIPERWRTGLRGQEIYRPTVDIP